jgi:hypothetical protein
MRLRQLIEESRERQSEVEEERAAHSQALLDAEAAKSRLEKELRVWTPALLPIPRPTASH